MNSNPRQINLLDTVRARGSVTVEQLADMLGVTLQTVRRDVQRLADEGLLTRFHGGVRVPSSTTENIGYLERRVVDELLVDHRDVAQKELTQIYPQPGWVEHDPMEIWRSQLATAREVLVKAKLKPTDIHAIGITNQRETTVLWNRRTGQPVHHAEPPAPFSDLLNAAQVRLEIARDN